LCSLITGPVQVLKENQEDYALTQVRRKNGH